MLRTASRSFLTRTISARALYVSRAMSSSAAPPPPTSEAALSREQSYDYSLVDGIFRAEAIRKNKKTVADDFFRIQKETEALGLGLERTTVGDILMEKGLTERGTWLWVNSNDLVCDAVRKMTAANVGALMVMHSEVLDANKDGVITQDELESANVCKAVAGIITERDYLKKIIVANRSSRTTTVGEIMTKKDVLKMVKTSTPVLDALRLMNTNRFRHLPVITEDKTMAGLISIGDLTKVVIEEHHKEVWRLRDFVMTY